MKKFTKVVKVIFLVLAVVVAVGYVGLYIFDNERAMALMDKVMDYVNRPLPIVGVSLSILGVLGFNLFRNTIYGKNFIDKVKAEFTTNQETVNNKYEDTKKEITAVLNGFQLENDLLVNAFIEFCESSPNVKYKAFATKLKTEYESKKTHIRDEIRLISTFAADEIVACKDDVVKTIKESVEKEMVAKYGKEAKNSDSREEKM